MTRQAKMSTPVFPFGILATNVVCFPTNVEVCDLKALLLGQLQHHLNVVSVGNAQRVSSQ